MSKHPLAAELAALHRRISELERRLENSARQGKVAEVDPEKGLARLEVGVDGGKPQLGPWVRYAQMAGALKVHTPPTVGQTYMQVAPGGDFEQAVLLPLGWSESNKSPGKTADPVGTYGALKFTVGTDTLTLSVPKLLLECGGSTFELTGDGLTLAAGVIELSGDALEHNGLNVGSTHVHGGVERGGVETFGPQ